MQLPLIPPTPPTDLIRIVVDTNVLIRGLLHERDRTLIADPRLALHISVRAWDELERHLPRRILAYVRGRPGLEIGEARLTNELRAFAMLYLTRVDGYDPFESEARERIPRDPDDWHTVAVALALDAAIWTEDRHFFGCGVATWTTDTLRTYLTRI